MPMPMILILGNFASREHFAARPFRSRPTGTGDDRVPDVQLDEVRDFVDEGDVAIVDAVTGVYLQPRFRRADAPLRADVRVPVCSTFSVNALASAPVCNSTMSAPIRSRHRPARSTGIDKKADANAGGMEPFHRGAKLALDA